MPVRKISSTLSIPRTPLYVCARDQEQVDKLLEIRETIPQILQVVYWEDRGMWDFADEWLASYPANQATGADFRQQEPGMFDTVARSTNTMDTIILSMTSGTTSLPKFAEVTHYQLVYGHALNYDYVDSRQSDNWLSFSPMAWLAEQAFGFTSHLIAGVQVNSSRRAGNGTHGHARNRAGRIAFPQPRLGKFGARCVIPHSR